MKVAFLILALLLFSSGVVSAQTATASLSISFTDNSDNEDGFHITRSGTPTGTFAPLVTITSDAAQKLAIGRTVTHVDANLPFSTQFCYKVTAFNSAGDSPPLGPVCAITISAPIQIPVQPVGLTVKVNQTIAPTP